MPSSIKAGNSGKIPIPFGGGMQSVGDPAQIENGNVLLCQNLLPRPGRYAARAPFVYDGLMSISGLLAFDDYANGVQRLLAIKSSDDSLYEKSATKFSETWSGSLGTVSGTRLSHYCDFDGVSYGLMDDADGKPLTAFSFDGTNITLAPFTATIGARAAASFIDRIFFIRPRAVFTLPATAFIDAPATTYSYDWTALTHLFSQAWRATNTVIRNITTGSQTVCRLFPQSTANKACTIHYNDNGFADGPYWMFDIPLVDHKQFLLWRFAVRPVDPTNVVPLTLSMRLGYINGAAVAPNVTAGDMVINPNGYVNRVITSGTMSTYDYTTWSTTPGATFSDGAGTAVLMVESSTTLSTLQITVPAKTDGADFSYYYLLTEIPSRCSVGIYPQIDFWNDAYTSMPALSPIDISLKDGKTDGDPSKQNYGSQWTFSPFYYPFFNQESSATATIDLPDIMWSEISDGKTIKAANTYTLVEEPGEATAVAATVSRLAVFKRNALWLFTGQASPTTPIRRETFISGVGCLGPLAIDTYRNICFFIGDTDIYTMSIDNGTPQGVCGDGMREEIMAKEATWVEKQTTCNRPLLAIDQTQFIVWIYTQKSKLYAYDLRSSRWSVHTTPNNAEVDTMMWNENTGNMYVAFNGYGLTRMDYSVNVNDTIDNTANTYPASMAVTFQPLEFEPDRSVVHLEQARILYSSQITQTGQTVEFATSFDQGSTFPRTINCTPGSTTPAGKFSPIWLPLRQTAPSITLRVTRTGSLGEGSWSLSPRVSADVTVLRGEYEYPNPTSGTANLTN